MLIVEKGKKVKQVDRYIDTSGIRTNPPNFIEVQKGCTLNIKVDDYDLIVPLHGYINYAYYSGALKRCLDTINGATEEDQIQQRMIAYSALISVVYNTCKSVLKKKELKKFKKSLYAKAFDDVDWFLNVLAEIEDYWTFIKKKVAHLAAGTTPRQIYGERCTWDYVRRDLQRMKSREKVTEKYLKFTPKNPSNSIT
jgi:hypothetical protein